MIATHSIKYNGVWYKAGDEIKETAEVDNLIKRKRLAEQI